MALFLCLVLLISALSVVFAAPEVKIGRTTIVGRDIPSLQQEFFGGLVHFLHNSPHSIADTAIPAIPFAKPPVGSLRLKPPVFKDTYDEDTLNATQFGIACLQFNTTLEESSEDCLTLNIYRPAALPPNASLPVLVWVYGGGFDRRVDKGTSAMDASAIVGRSVQRGTPIIYVSFNYRLGPLGFPQGREAEEKGALNLALKDELLALEWVNKHIDKFGGNKDKVTVGGVSSGAIMTAILFMHSSLEKISPRRTATPLTHRASFRQHSWDQFVSSVPTCANLAGTDNTFDCLLRAKATDILKGVNASRADAIEGFPWDPTLDAPGGLFPDYPSVLFKFGQFARIPFISGTNMDEGTVFVDPTQNFTTNLVRHNIFRNLSTPFLETFEKKKFDNAVDRTLQLYPDDPSLGSPFGTGDNTFGLSPGFKRVSAISGDVSYLSQRRMRQQTLADNPFSIVKSYGYLWKQGTIVTEIAPEFGVLHGSDSHYFFNDTLVDTVTPGALEVGVALMDYFISFIDSLDPNDGKGVERPQWSVYTKHDPMIMQMQALNTSLIPDTFRKEQTDFINSLPDIFHH
ncbi:hypothetical protein D9758_007283 [Tetrapyrgos nigripes]|uniref:Carboxylic ester hydrolase n=1 Tax=Tetrapyrgos nigripes TaxID=182062 RepID=A0A8H5GBD1_9AGAR|nr:hypothetical protein D9758_007283 [Tetrapyrgos nigripes]